MAVYIGERFHTSLDADADACDLVAMSVLPPLNLEAVPMDGWFEKPTPEELAAVEISKRRQVDPNSDPVGGPVTYTEFTIVAGATSPEAALDAIATLRPPASTSP